MLAANRGLYVGWLAGRFAGKIGHLYSPGDQRGPFPFIPYALDNGAFAAFLHKRPFAVAPWRALLEWARAAKQPPEWVLVPDVVQDKAGTLRRWQQYSKIASTAYAPLAFAVQDGMLPRDVPATADVVFVGGSTAWKWHTVGMWAESFPRVHVGRVNSPKRLYECRERGVESIDGTGWCINPNGEQWRGLVEFHDWQHNYTVNQTEKQQYGT